MAQQTAAEWLIEQIESGKIEIVYSNKIHSIKCIPEIKEQAKEMEKQQREELALEYFKAGQDSMEEGGKSFDQYHEQTSVGRKSSN